MGDPAKHSIFPPSAAYRWTICPGSIKEAAKAPPQQDSPESIEGTDAHWVAEQALKQRVPAAHLIRSEMPSGAKCTTVMTKYVQEYIDYVKRHETANGGKLYVEQRVEMPKIDSRFWGTSDVIQVTKYGTLHVFDLKYGMWLVEAEKSKQMMSYALGALTRFKNYLDLTKPVTAHICQPRPEHPSGKFRVDKFSINQLIEFGNLCKSAIQDSDSETPTYLEGEHCRFCPGEFTCETLNKMGRKVWT